MKNSVFFNQVTKKDNFWKNTYLVFDANRIQFQSKITDFSVHAFLEFSRFVRKIFNFLALLLSLIRKIKV